jgi:hypothetical protein
MLQYLVQQLAGELETVEGERTTDRKQIFRAFGAIGRASSQPAPVFYSFSSIPKAVFRIRKVVGPSGSGSVIICTDPDPSISNHNI